MSEKEAKALGAFRSGMPIRRLGPAVEELALRGSKGAFDPRWAAVLLLGLLSLVPSALAGQEPTAGPLEVTRLDLPQGEVTVYLPADFGQGGTITGTVIGKPAGEKEKQRQKNLELLNDLRFELATVEGEVSDDDPSKRRFVLPVLAAGTAALALRGSDGRVRAETAIPVAEQTSAAEPSSQFRVPPFGQIGQPLAVSGPFDGMAGTTGLKIDGKPALILAESPRQTVAVLPPEAAGPVTVEVSDGNASARATTRLIGFEWRAEDTRLKPDESTTATLKLHDLDALTSGEGNLVVVIVNQTPSIVILEGGPTQILTVAPGDVEAGGTYVKTFRLIGKALGDFALNARLIDSEASPKPEPSIPEPEVIEDVGRAVPSGGVLREPPPSRVPAPTGDPTTGPNTGRDGGNTNPPGPPRGGDGAGSSGQPGAGGDGGTVTAGGPGDGESEDRRTATDCLDELDKLEHISVAEANRRGEQIRQARDKLRNMDPPIPLNAAVKVLDAAPALDTVEETLKRLDEEIDLKRNLPELEIAFEAWKQEHEPTLRDLNRQLAAAYSEQQKVQIEGLETWQVHAINYRGSLWDNFFLTRTFTKEFKDCQQQMAIGFLGRAKVPADVYVKVLRDKISAGASWDDAAKMAIDAQFAEIKKNGPNLGGQDGVYRSGFVRMARCQKKKAQEDLLKWFGNGPPFGGLSRAQLELVVRIMIDGGKPSELAAIEKRREKLQKIGRDCVELQSQRQALLRELAEILLNWIQFYRNVINQKLDDLQLYEILLREYTIYIKDHDYARDPGLRIPSFEDLGERLRRILRTPPLPGITSVELRFVDCYYLLACGK